MENRPARAQGLSQGLLKLLEDGEDVLLFPRAAASDGTPSPLRAALIAIKSGAPVVPAYVSGTFEAMPMGASTVRPVHIEVLFGEIIDPGEYGALGKEGRTKLMEKMRESFEDLASQVALKRAP